MNFLENIRKQKQRIIYATYYQTSTPSRLDTCTAIKDAIHMCTVAILYKFNIDYGFKTPHWLGGGGGGKNDSPRQLIPSSALV